jgi:hypothetical protein
MVPWPRNERPAGLVEGSGAKCLGPRKPMLVLGASYGVQSSTVIGVRPISPPQIPPLGISGSTGRLQRVQMCRSGAKRPQFPGVLLTGPTQDPLQAPSCTRIYLDRKSQKP